MKKYSIAVFLFSTIQLSACDALHMSYRPSFTLDQYSYKTEISSRGGGIGDQGSGAGSNGGGGGTGCTLQDSSMIMTKTGSSEFVTEYATVTRMGALSQSTLNMVLTSSCFDPNAFDQSGKTCPEGVGGECQSQKLTQISMSLKCANTASEIATTCELITDGEEIDLSISPNNVLSISLYDTPDSCDSTLATMYLPPFTTPSGLVRATQVSLGTEDIVIVELENVVLKPFSGPETANVTLNGIIQAPIYAVEACTPR